MSRRTVRWLGWLGIPTVLVGAVLIFWRWDWFIPVVQSRASAALGRPVSIGHLHVGLGRILRVRADDVVIANPPRWQGDPLARIRGLAVDVDAWSYIRHGVIVVPLVEVDKPRLSIVKSAEGAPNYKLDVGTSSGTGSAPRIGTVLIRDGLGQVQIPRLRADFNFAIATRDHEGASRIEVDARGTYAGQPVVGQFVGGALLSPRDASDPWPVDLRVQNGPTRLSVIGRIEDPLRLSGAALTLRLAARTRPDCSR